MLLQAALLQFPAPCLGRAPLVMVSDATIDSAKAKVDELMDELRVADSLTEIFNLFKHCNKYIDLTEPWKLAKDEAAKDRLETVLFNLITGIEAGADLLSSFMPSTAEKIVAQTNGGDVTDKPQILFARMDAKEVLEKAEALNP